MRLPIKGSSWCSAPRSTLIADSIRLTGPARHQEKNAAMELDGKTERMTGTAHDKPSGGIPWSRLCAYFFTFLITFLFVDFFQVKESARHGLVRQFNRYFATTYPECIPKSFGEIFRCMFAWSPPRSQAGMPARWCPSFCGRTRCCAPPARLAIRMEDHARVLETILPMQPRGVLVDLFFLDDPKIRGDTTLQDLIDVICDYHEASESESGTRLYLIKPAPPRTRRTRNAIRLRSNHCRNADERCGAGVRARSDDAR